MSRLPRIGDSVSLVVPQREQVPARVESIGIGVIELDLLLLPRTPAHQLERGSLMLEFVNEDGVARLHGRLDETGVRTIGHAFDAAASVHLRHKGTVQLLQRRDSIRAITSLPLTVMALAGFDHFARRAQAREISGGGMVVQGLGNAEQGDGYRFELDLVPGELPIEGQFRVIRAEGPDRASVHFTAIDQRDRVRIMQRAFQLSRHTRRRSA
jgi:hypothetical protein